MIERETKIAPPPLCPEIRFHLATEITPIWEATEETLARAGLDPPFWAFPWAGGQALSRYLLDHPEAIASKRMLDFAAGSGICAIAAAKAGAASVTAAEVDGCAIVAIGLNRALDGVAVETIRADLVGCDVRSFDAVLAADVCYQRSMAARVVSWLSEIATNGALVLLADPGRAYAPRKRPRRLACYAVPTSPELEDLEARETVVWELLAAPA
jgi:predicted nicotinamide N-methyase